MFSSYPKALLTTISMESLDRVLFYGLQSLLVLFLAKDLSLDHAAAYELFGVYTALSFIMPLLGGVIGDRLISSPVCLLLGVVFFLLGSIVLCSKNTELIYSGLTCFMMGVGLIKSNSAGMVGALYGGRDSDKEAGFTLYYIGMNVGSIVGPAIFGFIAYHFHWHLCFIVSAVLSVIALFCMLIRFRHCYQKVRAFELLSLKNTLLAIVSIALLVAGMMFLFQHSMYFEEVMLIVGGITIVALAVYASRQMPELKGKIVLYAVLNFFSMFYMASFLQINSSLLVYIHEYVHRDILGITLPAPVFSALYSFFIIFSAPLMKPFFRKLEAYGCQDYLVNRVAVGLFFTMLSFAVFTLLTNASEWHGVNFPIYIILFANFLLGLGELSIVPAMIAAPSRMLPANMQATFIGSYFLFNAFSAYFASKLAQLSADNLSSGVGSRAAFTLLFSKITVIMFFGALLLWLLKPLLRRLNHEFNEVA